MKVITPIEIESNAQFSRGSTATYVDSAGLVKTAAIDELRVNYDYANSTSDGILIESAATNLALRSQEFDNATWGKARSAVDLNVTLAPDGTLSADRLKNNGIIDTTGYISQNFTWLGSTNYIFSVFVKAELVTRCALDFVDTGGFSSGGRLTFDLETGSIVSTTSDYTNVIALSNGWYRIALGCTPIIGAGSVRLNLATDVTAGTDGYFIWGAQVEIASTESSYIPTVAATVTRAADILGDMLTSTVAEPDTGEALWNAATNYAVDDQVIRTTTHKKYVNILAGVNATLPEVDAALPEPTRWVEIGSTNRYAMFDTLRNTQTETTSPLSVVVKAGQRLNSIGVLAIEGGSINIRMVSDNVEVYNYTQNLNTRVVLNWYDYFFEQFSNIPATVKFDLPPFTQGEIFVTITSNTGMVKCGALVLGNYTDIGQLQYGARVSATNFSRIDREFDGTAVLVQRQTKPKVSGTLMFDKAQTNKILALKQSLNAVPAVWSGLDDENTDDYFNGLLILGIYKLFDADIAYPENAMLDIEIEEI